MRRTFSASRSAPCATSSTSTPPTASRYHHPTTAKFAVLRELSFSLPPCGGGSGWRVGRLRRGCAPSHEPPPPPPPPLPTRGRGEEAASYAITCPCRGR